MSATKITSLQYDTIMGIKSDKYPYNLYPEYQYIDWNKAAYFCNRLSDKSGLQRCYDETTWACDVTKNGYRLPTEAEWEYSCRAGSLADQSSSSRSNRSQSSRFTCSYPAHSSSMQPVFKNSSRRKRLISVAIYFSGEKGLRVMGLPQSLSPPLSNHIVHTPVGRFPGRWRQ